MIPKHFNEWLLTKATALEVDKQSLSTSWSEFLTIILVLTTLV